MEHNKESLGNKYLLSRFESFLAVAESHSIKAASEALGKDERTLRSQIVELESASGGRLFTKDYQGVALTQLGRRVYPYIQNIFDNLIHYEKTTIKEGSFISPARPLKIVTSFPLATLVYPEKLARFRELYPNVHIDMSVSSILPNIMSMDIDVVIWPSHKYDGSSLLTYEVAYYHPKLYASERYLKKYGEPQSEKDLKNHRFIGYTEDFIINDSSSVWYSDLIKNNGGKIFDRTNNSYTALQQAKMGLGIVSYAEEMIGVLGDSMKNILPDLTGPKITTYYSYSRAHKNNQTIKALFEFLKDS